LAQIVEQKKTTTINNLRGKPFNWLRGEPTIPNNLRGKLASWTHTTPPPNWLRGKKISPRFEGLRGEPLQEPHNPPQGRSSNNAPLTL